MVPPISPDCWLTFVQTAVFHQRKLLSLSRSDKSRPLRLNEDRFFGYFTAVFGWPVHSIFTSGASLGLSHEHLLGRTTLRLPSQCLWNLRLRWYKLLPIMWQSLCNACQSFAILKQGSSCLSIALRHLMLFHGSRTLPAAAPQLQWPSTCSKLDFLEHSYNREQLLWVLQLCCPLPKGIRGSLPRLPFSRALVLR